MMAWEMDVDEVVADIIVEDGLETITGIIGKKLLVNLF